MAIVTKSQLSSRASSLYESQRTKYFSASSAQTSIFLSHKHSDKKEVKDAKKMLGNIGVEVYVDWLDPDMPETTRGETGN